MACSNIQRQLEELQLIQCSVLPGEALALIEDDGVDDWKVLLEEYVSTGSVTSNTREDQENEFPGPIRPCKFRLGTDEADVWFEVELPKGYPDADISKPVVLVKGNSIKKTEQERWQGIVKDKLVELDGADYFVFELLTQHLLPMLHAAEGRRTSQASTQDSEPMTNISLPKATTEHTYHGLFTSHHLISPTKRRNLQKWSSELSLTGFAKVGYPGVIYFFGTQSSVEDFVSRVKAMQWLALKLRFSEPLQEEHERAGRSWVEVEKVGDVVEHMRHWGREKYVVEMGIGSAGTVGTGLAKAD